MAAGKFVYKASVLYRLDSGQIRNKLMTTPKELMLFGIRTMIQLVGMKETLEIIEKEVISPEIKRREKKDAKRNEV